MDLYNIFYVNRGHLLALDVPVSQWAVNDLQQNIRQLTGVRVSDQVLLISGGETLDADKRVNFYSGVGTTVNPVYLFQRSSRHERDEVICSQEINELYHIIDDAIDQAMRVESCSDPHTIYLTLPEKARQCRQAAQTAIHSCAQLAQEHQLLHQGWLALVSNMDDSVSRLRKRASRFQQHVEKVQQQREKAVLLLHDFDGVLDQLKNIILPAALLAHSRGLTDHSLLSDISLYEWISASDPNHSLQDLVDQVKEQFEKFGESDARVTSHTIDKVVEQSRDMNYREIKGMNKRLTQLDHYLTQAEGREKKIAEYVNLIVQTPSRIDQGYLQELISDHRHHMSKIYDELKEIRNNCTSFYKSKIEVLTSVRNRLNTWIVQAYDRLHNAHLEMLVFEEKFNGLKQRLDLVRQIKEAPVVYATAVCEVLRRGAFHKEFSMWHALHVEKCTIFSGEESQIRAQFTSKMERHFLRVLFPGMFDPLPCFFVKSLIKFDQSIGPLDADYLRQMRKNVQDLEQYLKVTSPQVFQRLSIRDPTQPSQTVPHMKREESFFTADPSQNLATLTKNFPSSNWLSSEDTMDSSPSAMPTLLMAKSPPSRVGSVTSLHMPIAPSLNQLSMLGEEDEGNIQPSSSIAKSAPIQIPTPQPRQMSEKSSQFSTPDDHFDTNDHIDEGQFPVDDLTSRSQSMEFLKPIVIEILSLSKDLLDIRAELANNQDSFKENFDEIRILATDSIKSQVEALAIDYHNSKKENEKLKSDLIERDAQLNTLKLNVADINNKHEEVLKEKEDEIARLTDNEKNFNLKLKEIKSEAFKAGIIELELEKDRLRREYDLIIEDKEKEIRQLKKDLEKKNGEIERLRADPESETFRKNIVAEIRNELEKESKKKIELLTKGIVQKKEEEQARSKKEMEFELKMATQEMKFSMKWLAAERDRLKDLLIQSSADGNAVVKAIDDDIKSAIFKEEGVIVPVYGTSVATQTEMLAMATSLYPQIDVVSAGMMTSQFNDMKESTFIVDTSQTSSEEASRVLSPDGDSELVVAIGNEMAVQTRIGMRSMDRMVAIDDISEGSTVLVIWHEKHNAYILFSSSTYNHFVKESSVRRLGLATTLPNIPRRNWILGKVSHLDLCIIRKSDNRYRLPVDTRVYRVDVDPIPIGGRNPRSHTN